MIDDIINYYLNDLNTYGTSYIASRSNNFNGSLAGINGENLVYPILRKYTDKIYKEVVIWGKKENFTSEIDFICIINGFVVLVEVKEWYGTIEKSDDGSKVFVTQINFEGKEWKQIRTNPLAAIGGFTSDLCRQFPECKFKKDINLKRFLVFTRDDLHYDNSFNSKHTIVCHLNEFDYLINKLSKEQPEDPIGTLPPLPSWDLYYDAFDERWFKVVLPNKMITVDEQNIPISEIDCILFDKYDLSKVYVKKMDGLIIEGHCDKKTIKLNCSMKFVRNRIRFIKLNNLLHSLQK